MHSEELGYSTQRTTCKGKGGKTKQVPGRMHWHTCTDYGQCWTVLRLMSDDTNVNTDQDQNQEKKKYFILISLQEKRRILKLKISCVCVTPGTASHRADETAH